MGVHMKKLLLTLFLVAAFAVQPAVQPAMATSTKFDAGKKAYMDEDWLKAIMILRPLAQEGDHEAMVLLANMYNDGKGVVQDFQKALSLYNSAASLGNTNAMFAIATMTITGIGTPRDTGKAIEWYRKAAEKNNQIAQFTLGTLYLRSDPDIGYDVEKNLNNARKWFQKAAENSFDAQTRDAAEQILIVLNENEERILNGEDVDNIEGIPEAPQNKPFTGVIPIDGGSVDKNDTDSKPAPE